MTPNHYQLDVWDVPYEVCMDLTRVCKLFDSFEDLLGVYIISRGLPTRDLKVGQQGIIVNYTINLSYFYCHSFAERGMMAFDIFSCGPVPTKKAVDVLLKEYGFSKDQYILRAIVRKVA